MKDLGKSSLNEWNKMARGSWGDDFGMEDSLSGGLGSIPGAPHTLSTAGRSPKTAQQNAVLKNWVCGGAVVGLGDTIENVEDYGKKYMGLGS